MSTFLAELGATYDYEVGSSTSTCAATAGGGEPFSSTLTRRLVAEGDVEGGGGDPGPPAPRRGRRRARRAARS